MTEQAPRPGRRIVLRYGEVALKGRNRHRFQKRLQQNLRHRLRGLGLDWRPRRAHGRIWVPVPEAFDGDPEAVAEELADVPGVVWAAATRWLPAPGDRRAPGLAEAAVALARSREPAEGPFAVRARRAEKRYPATAEQLERELGEAIRTRTAWSRVDLDNPARTFYVDVEPDGIDLAARRIRGAGGLPVGCGGRVVGLLSGGLDSPVAAHRIAKRGCRIDFLHFTATPMQQAQARAYKVAELARLLSRHAQRCRLHLVPYVHFDMAVMSDKTAYELVLFRRFMLRCGETLAHRLGAQALVTGDNLGQVASQTLSNVAACADGIAMPILRPLVGYDKEQIVAAAREIGTYETSIQPYKDCCALVSGNPKTSSDPERLRAIEQRLFDDYEALIERSLDDATVLVFDGGRDVTEEAGAAAEAPAGESPDAA